VLGPASVVLQSLQFDGLADGVLQNYAAGMGVQV